MLPTAGFATRSLLLALLVGCAPRVSAPSPTSPSRQQPHPDTEKRVDAPAAHFQSTLSEFTAALRGGDLGQAASLLETARAEVPQQHPELELVAYYQAALYAYRGEHERAVSVLTEHLARVAIPADSSMEFAFHNALVMLRTAQGDLTSALVECDEMVDAGQRGTWMDEQQRESFVLLKKHWHRAYLLRMVAELSTGSRREAALHYAEAARRAYRELAAPLGEHGDSIAVLDAFFAVHDGNRTAALEAARRVEIAENDDAEDLYLTQMAFDVGGDAAAAAAVRKRISQLDDVSIAVPIIATWIANDAATAGGAPRWSPRHPRGVLP